MIVTNTSIYSYHLKNNEYLIRVGESLTISTETWEADDQLARTIETLDKAGYLFVSDHPVNYPRTDAFPEIINIVGSSLTLPTNAEWNENAFTLHEASDSGPFTPYLFQIKTLAPAEGFPSSMQLGVKVPIYLNGAFTSFNDNGDELLESDPLANGGEGEVRINGIPLSATGYQQTSDKGQPDGYASLDVDGIVPLSQLPEIPAVVPDVAYMESSGATLSQGNVTANIAEVFRWQRVGRTVYARVYLQTETAGEEGEPWTVDLPEPLPAIEYSGGSNGPIAVGSGYVNIGATVLRVVTAVASEDAGGPGPTRRLVFATTNGELGQAGAADRMGVGSELQLSLVYEAAEAA